MSKFDNKDGFLPHEVFISYRRTEGWQFAFLLNEKLEANGISAFYDQKVLPEFVGEDVDWKEAIKYNLKFCEVFILVISGKTLFYTGGKKDPRTHKWPDNDNMWEEVQFVVEENKKRSEKDKIEIIPIFIDGYQIPACRKPAKGETDEDVGIWGKTAEQAKRYKSYFDNILKKEHLLNDADSSFDNITHTYIPKIKKIINKKHPNSDSFYNNSTYAHTAAQKALDEKEEKRLETQADNTVDEIKTVIDSKLCAYEELYVLDVGCANAYKTNRLFGDCTAVKYLLGVDSSESYIKHANERFARKNDLQTFEFKQSNILKDEFDETLSAAVKKTGHKFNLVYIGMVLMHVNDPAKVIETLSKYVVKGGTIIVQECEDSLNLAYANPSYGPEINAISDKFNLIWEEAESSGYRHTGKTIYGLVHSKFDNFKIEYVYYPYHISHNQTSALSSFNSTLEQVEEELQRDDLRVSRWAKFKGYQAWLLEKKNQIIGILTDEKYFSLNSTFIVSAIRNEK